MFTLKSTFSKHPKTKHSSTSPAFTIIELLVVIVVIAILATITVVSYTGITSRATIASLQSDLDTTSKQLKLYQTLYGSYPISPLTNNCPVTPINDPVYCLKPSSGNTFTYQSDNTTNPQSFSIKATKDNVSYITSDNSSPSQISTNPTNLNCPTGFIPVPGSLTYGTGDFCVMKYEAKNAGSNVPTSTAAGLPFVSITQTNAMDYSKKIANCSICHLITEKEWLTVAQNVLSVPSNWSSGTVDTGYIYSGHNDNAPASALVADTNDSNGYSGETNTGGNQRRTLTLTNGEVIWDLAGNVWEWTAGQVTTGQPGITGAGYAYREWTAITNPGTLAVNPSASTTGLSGSAGWNSTNGIGQIYSKSDETGLRGFLRSNGWGDGISAGVLTLALHYVPGNAGSNVGFRVAR